MAQRHRVMRNNPEYPNDAKEVFTACGTCSRTFAHLLNRAFGYPDETAEKAMNLMAGGILNQGYQCGMLWGASLAVGAEAYREYEDLDLAVTSAVNATQHLIASFVDQTDTVNCREIIGLDLTSKIGMARFMLRVNSQGMENSYCFNLAEQWAPQAIEAGRKGLGDTWDPLQNPRSCASEVVREMGGTEEEMAMVSGFAGGLGFYGGACGALSAAIWKNMLDWCRENPGKDPPYFNNKTAKKILKAFKTETKGEMRCNKICGRRFLHLNDHTEYLNKGGCSILINLLAHSADA
jgi:hypothetical protein